MKHISVQELSAWLNDTAAEQPLLLDVREPNEFAICHLDQAELMPMRTVPEHMSDFNQDAPIVCICHLGGRSAQVATFLEQHGFTNVINLTGGMHAWATSIDPSMATY